MPADGSDTTDVATSRRQMLRTLGTTAVASGVLATSAGASRPQCVDCVTLGTIAGQPSPGDSHEFTHGDRTVTVEVRDVYREDGEVVCVDLSVQGGTLCQVAVKGGPHTRVRRFGTGVVSVYPCAPAHHNPNRRNFAISDVTLSLCLPENESDDAGDTPDHGPGDHPEGGTEDAPDRGDGDRSADESNDEHSDGGDDQPDDDLSDGDGDTPDDASDGSGDTPDDDRGSPTDDDDRPARGTDDRHGRRGPPDHSEGEPCRGSGRAERE